jgi:hypothetical protein
MKIYKIGSALVGNKEMYDKLIAQAPRQAGSILTAIWELSNGQATPVPESDIVKHISEDLARLAPTAKNAEVVDGFVAYYRTMLGKLPTHLLEQMGGGRASGGGTRTAAEVVDPTTGESLGALFARPKVQNPGSRKKKLITIGELADELESDEAEAPDDELEGEGEEASAS